MKLLRKTDAPARAFFNHFVCVTCFVPIVLQKCTVKKVLKYIVFLLERCNSAGTAIYWQTMKMQPASLFLRMSNHNLTDNFPSTSIALYHKKLSPCPNSGNNSVNQHICLLFCGTWCLIVFISVLYSVHLIQSLLALFLHFS